MANSPPDTPSSVTVSRADGTIAASGYAVSGATKYHITYTDNGGQSWQLAALNHTADTITINVDNAKSYIVGVRAGNSTSWSGWRNSASAGPFTPNPTPTPTPTPAPAQPPATPSTVSVTRADGTLTASGYTVANADTYHITYTDNGGQSWQLAALNHTEDTIIINVDNAKSYIVGVRAKNSAGGSGWRNSASASPFTPAPTPTPTPAPAAGIIVQDTSGNAITALSIPEGGEASYQVKLASQPAQAVEVCIGLSVRDNNDPDITFKGEASGVVALKLPFTPENWNTAQTVTLVAAEDDDYTDGARDLDHDTRTSDYFAGTVWLAVTEIDNDEPPPAAPTGLTATAGDGSVTLTWNDPANSSITGYEYQVNHNDTGTGNMSGWGSWQSIADSDADSTSHTVAALTNGKEYRYHLRAVNTGGVSKPAPQFAPWYVAATPAAPALSVTDPTPTSAVLTLGNYGGAWHYSVTENSGGASGMGIASMASGQSNQSNCIGPIQGSETTVQGLDPNSNYTINAYLGNCEGGAVASSGAQTLSAISLTAGTQTTEGATLTITGYNGNWWVGQTSPFLISCLPASGATATITGLLPGRDYTYAAYSNENCYPRDNTLATASFTTQYGLRADELTEDSATLVIEGSGLLTNWWYKRTAPSGDNTCRAVTFSHKSVSLDLNPNTTYGYSAYLDSGCATAVGSVTFKTPGLDNSVNRGGGNSGAGSVTLTIRNWTAGWWYQQTLPTAGTCTSVAAGTSSATATGFTFNHTTIDPYAFEAYSATGCAAADRIASTTLFPATPQRGGVENVAATTATILAYGESSSNKWGYQSTETGSVCIGPFAGAGSNSVASAPVSGLTPGTEYTFRTYQVSGPNYQCYSSNGFGRNFTFTTTPASVSNLDEPQVGSTMPVGWSANQWVANAFSTGSGASEFTVKRITVLLGDDIIPAPAHDLKVKLYSSDTSGNPDTALATLTGPARPPANAEAVYACSGSGCDLDPDTTYFVVLSVPDVTVTSGLAYRWQRAATQRETADPADSGFSIANEIRHTDDGGATWMRLVQVQIFGVEYTTPAPSLSASAIEGTTASLTLEDEGSEGVWYAKRISPSAGTCSSAAGSGSTLALTGLAQNTSYGYAAYRDSACMQVVADVTFTTLRTLTASNITDTTATLTLSGSGTGKWYAKYTSPSGGTCSSGEDYGTAHSLANLQRNTAHTFEAYSDSGCTTLLGTTTFTTEANWLTVTNLSMTGATLNLTGVSSWHYKANTGPDSTCQGPVSGTSDALTGLTKGSTYNYTTYSDACTTTVRNVTIKTFIDAPVDAKFTTSGSGVTVITTVEWDRNSAASGAVGYQIQGRSSATGGWSTVRTVSPSTAADYREQWTYGGASMNYIRIRATQGGYHSAWVAATNQGG